MNILFFLTPKAMCAYIESDDTLRQAMERMEHSGYAALPYWTRAGNTRRCYRGRPALDAQAPVRDGPAPDRGAFHFRDRAPPHRAACAVDTRVEDLISVAAEQNFVPVI